ncbi:MAG: HD domain-containing protein [Gemmatimonadales bacterium]|nr:HD domain-containing protein [Gemmatimonadales bacterium]
MTPPPPDLRRLVVGERVQHPFLLRAVDPRESPGGGSYTVLTLGNATGELPAYIWSEQQHLIAGLRAGDVVQVIATVGEYRGKRKLEPTSIRPLPAGEARWEELVPAVANREWYWDQLDEWRAKLRGPRLRAVLDLAFEDHDVRARFGDCPASTHGHHALLGGLLKHVWEVGYMARAMAKALRADPDLVTAGALLHDIGKLEAYDWSTGAFTTTDAGRALGHVVLGGLWIERRLAEAGGLGLTPAERLLLQHFVFSHHGRLEHGAAVRPMTLEAQLLHFADDASAKGDSVADALADPASFDGEAAVSSRGLWQLDGARVWRCSADWGAAEKANDRPA